MLRGEEHFEKFTGTRKIIFKQRNKLRPLGDGSTVYQTLGAEVPGANLASPTMILQRPFPLSGKGGGDFVD